MQLEAGSLDADAKQEPTGTDAGLQANECQGRRALGATPLA